MKSEIVGVSFCLSFAFTNTKSKIKMVYQNCNSSMTSALPAGNLALICKGLQMNPDAATLQRQMIAPCLHVKKSRFNKRIYNMCLEDLF